MKVSAVLRRLVLSVLFLISSNSCVSGVNGRQVGEEANFSSVSDGATMADTAAVELPVESAATRILATVEQDSIGIELLESGRSNHLVINAGESPDYVVTRLSSPERLVIDLKSGQPSGLTRNFDASDTELLSRVRVGAHPDKTRLVLDLNEDRNVQHQVELVEGSIVVSLNPGSDSAQLAMDLNSAMSAEVEPSAELPAVEAVQPEAVLVADSEPAITGEGVIELAPEPQAGMPSSEVTELDPMIQVADQEPLAAPPVTELHKLSIEQLGPGSNMLVAQVTNPGVYSFEKTAPSEYVLTLRNSKAEPLIAPVVALPESGLIRSARTVSEGDSVLVRIFAQAGTELSARVSSDKIIVAAEPGQVAAYEQDMRAQAAPEKAADAAGEEAKPAAAAEEGPAEVRVNGDAQADEPFDDEFAALMPKKYKGREISLDLQDTDIDNALRIIAEVSNLNIIASDDVTGKVTLRLIDVPWDQALDVILKTNGLDKVQEGNVIRIAPIEKLNQERQALKQLELSQAELEPLQVRYIRVSYAKASELKPLVETVVSERGVVTYDERTNQIIVKDITAGIRNVMELVSRIDLRTPQVLLETQIVEANRNLARELGSELGFEYIASPATGNPTGMNFPNTVNFGGGVPVQGGDPAASSFPVAASDIGGSAISLLLGSADGSKSLSTRLSALESEGRARVVSRPAVATTNNRAASIRSVEKIRVRTPQGGLSVATGQGASASGSSTVATETIEIGITLDVIPQASPDYYVLLDIRAKSSNLGSQNVDGIPSEIERSANSTVLVSSGETFAVGGIYQLIDNDAVDGVPFLKDVPFLGTFFRRTQLRNSDEELLFFITPRIIEGSFDDATMKVSS
ncbi:MAG: type IV pilus secretin PilQ [Deltaproteobacteria bacterium]|nr:type IV pilus secretin PilQ [Deltaproteobacteria bacterium]